MATQVKQCFQELQIPRELIDQVQQHKSDQTRGAHYWHMGHRTLEWQSVGCARGWHCCKLQSRSKSSALALARTESARQRASDRTYQMPLNGPFDFG